MSDHASDSTAPPTKAKPHTQEQTTPGSSTHAAACVLQQHLSAFSRGHPSLDYVHGTGFILPDAQGRDQGSGRPSNPLANLCVLNSKGPGTSVPSVHLRTTICQCGRPAGRGLPMAWATPTPPCVFCHPPGASSPGLGPAPHGADLPYLGLTATGRTVEGSGAQVRRR